MEPRKYTWESGQGRYDKDGVEWFACDPYPTWYRWENGELFTTELDQEFIDPCDCGAPLRAKELWEGGGVVCSKECGYWFCY